MVDISVNKSSTNQKPNKSSEKINQIIPTNHPHCSKLNANSSKEKHYSRRYMVEGNIPLTERSANKLDERRSVLFGSGGRKNR
jgi:hypothetical protein